MTARSLALSLLCVAPLAAQQARQPDFRWEKTLAAGNYVSIHNLNGDVAVTPSTSNKVEITGVKHGNSRYYNEVTIEVVETSRGIVICSIHRNADQECTDEGLRTHNDRRRGWRDRDFDDVSIDIHVKLPKNLEVDARSVSGDVSVVGAEGDVRAGSVSGDVEMDALRATSVRASSVSGNVSVRVLALTGQGPLKFTSVSGNVTAELPKNLDADVTMRSVSGSLDSDFPLTLRGRMSRHGLEAQIGRGGREIEVHTVSGNVRLRSAK